jgi:indolepyruvate ferredoxin oxidoreductase alpha subunit
VVTDACDGCGFCVERFECPALVMNAEKTRVDIDPILCVGCNVCIQVCPKGAIEEAKDR